MSMIATPASVSAERKEKMMLFSINGTDFLWPVLQNTR